MKSEIYNAVASLNSGFDAALESLKVLQESGVLAEQYVQDQIVLTEELRAGINHHMMADKLQAREAEDRAHFGRMRNNIEARLKSS